ncbi:MAG: Gfo/Idh/MocA family oxidoreductase [Firmicutes bacterium]|nr:Gfo/Idh/MocA family oxidoreductase [Bacillota bacterium]
MTDICLGIIGYGGMGAWHHKFLTESVPRIHVKGAHDVRGEALEKAEAAGLIAYPSLDALWADPDINLVTIATPNDYHKPLSIAALQAGKHVVCEKPVTLNAAELEDILAVSEETGRLFTVHQNRRWDKDYRVVREALGSGVIGEPYFIENKVQGSRRSLHGWRGHKQNGGGMLLDWGIHLLDQIMDLIPSSPVVSVCAHLLSLYTTEVDDNIKLLLRFENGVSSLLEMSTNCLIPAPRWHVQCGQGTLVVENWECDGKILTLREEGEMTWEDDIIYTAAGPTRTMARRPAYTMKERPLPEVAVDLTEYYNNVADAMEGRAELIVKPEQALRVMRVVDMLFASAEKGHGLACRI